jgi:hypothetical protein
MLADRHSLPLDRAYRSEEATEACDHGLALGEEGDQIARRRPHCEAPRDC